MNLRAPRSIRALARPLRVLTAAIAFCASPSSAFASETVQNHVVAPSPWMILPFIALLLAIAVMPFINRHWWERRYPHVAVALGLVAVCYYVFFLDNPMRMMHSGIEYVSFMCLIGSLFVVAGGIHISIRGHATPARNTMLLLFGALVSNIIGTTGASMILIRPYLKSNARRLHPYHIVFFIFLVSNIGGALTPIGDPPLFLGYLKGIPFFWVAENVWLAWIVATGFVLAVFYVFDAVYFSKMPVEIRTHEEEEGEKMRFQGLHNLVFILVILVAVFIQDPPFLREGLMLAAAIGSYTMTKAHVHKANHFNFKPIWEVGFLFLGLFATMVPALDWLELNASSLGISTPGQFFWGTGALSSFLDNAPTYLNFLSAAIGLLVRPELVAGVQQIIADASHANLGQFAPEIQETFRVLFRYHGDLVASGHVPLSDIQVSYLIGVHPVYVTAVSLGAVFFGACTYIGNAPNFMVKSIAEQRSVRMPSFFGYLVRFSIPILLPIFILIWLMFFHG